MILLVIKRLKWNNDFKQVLCLKTELYGFCLNMEKIKKRLT